MSDRIEAEILDVFGEEVDAAVDTPLVVIEGPKGDPGAPGKDGMNGETGPAGPQGLKGTDGITPTIGDNGNWYLGDTDTGVSARGGTADAVLYTAQTLTGQQKRQARVNIDALGSVAPNIKHYAIITPATESDGIGVSLSATRSGTGFELDISDANEGQPTMLTGVKTPTDTDTNAAATVEYVKDKIASGGVTPHIGDNGNWYIGPTDTGKPSRGEKGADGAPGIYYGATQPTGDTHPVWIDPGGDHDDGGLLPAVTAADNGKFLRVVNGAWAAAAINDANGVSF